MERQNNSQLELFSESAPEKGSQTRSASDYNFLKRIKGYEKVILLTIAILVTGIISFSFGVERGKRIVLSANKPVESAKVESASIPSAPEPAPVPAPVMVKKETLFEQSPVLASSGSFTIQVASFKNKDSALKEVEVLKKKGMTTQLIKKGQYTILCVGNFPNKETAQPLLSELRKRYNRCYIRRL